MFHFKGDTIITCELLVQMKHTEINECMCTGQLSPPFLFVKSTLSKAKEFASVMAFKEVYDCEILILGTERHPALYDFAEIQ